MRSCKLDLRTVSGLKQIAHPKHYPRSSVLFTEGQQPRGVYIIESGRVKLTANSADGKSFDLGVSEAGNVIGLAATIARRPHEVTAETLSGSHVHFVPSPKFLQFLQGNSQAAFCATELLSHMYLSAYQEVKSLGLSRTFVERLVGILLNETSPESFAFRRPRFEVLYTHGELAGMIGACRETVTRILNQFQSKGLVELRRSRIIIRDRTALARLVDG